MPMEWMNESVMFSSTRHRACLWPLPMLCRSNTFSWVRDSTSFTVITNLKAGRTQNRRSIREKRGAFSLCHGAWLLYFSRPVGTCALWADNKQLSSFQWWTLWRTAATHPPTHTSFLTRLIKSTEISPLWTGLSHDENMLQSPSELWV
jgi:hypothetical protein